MQNALRLSAARVPHSAFCILHSAFVILFLALLAPTALALPADRAISQYAHRVWRIEDGLPNSVVRHIVQSDDGYLWLGTYDGLTRYSGDSFTTFDKNTLPELPGNTVYALAKAHDGSFWIGTAGTGVAVYSHGHVRTISMRDGLPDNTVGAIATSADGAMWIGTSGGLCVDRNGKIEQIALKTFPAKAPIAAIAESGGFTWAGTRGGGLIALKNAKTIRAYTTADGLLADTISAVYGDRDGTLWIGTSKGLNRIRNGLIEKVPGAPADEVTSVLRDSNGSLWIGTYTSGLFRSTDGEHFSGYTAKEGLSNNSVRSIFEDAEKSLWVGTNGGLDRFTQCRFITVGAPEGLEDPYVRTVYQDRAGNVWIGSAHGLFRIDPNGAMSMFTAKDGLTADYILSITDTPDGALWVGTPAGLNRLYGGRVERFDVQHGLLNSFVRALFVDRAGTVWIGSDGGLNWFRNGRMEAPSLPGFDNSDIEAFAEDRDGSIWLASEERGLGHWSNGSFSRVATNEALATPNILSLVVGHDGALWIGTDSAGLIRLKDRQVSRITTKEGLADDKVVQLLDDGTRLWIGSSRGISSIDHNQLDDFVQKRRPNIHPAFYGYADGLRSVQCNGSVYPAAIRARDGRLWFATANGVATVWPDAQPIINARPPIVVIESVLANDKPADLSSLVLQPATKKFELHYAALSYVAPEKVLFRYKLEGFDRDWVDAGTRRVAYYTNIPPGHYRFVVKACNNSGIWNEAGASAAFQLLTPLWKTPYAYLIYVLAAAALIYSVVRWRIRRLRERADTLEQMVRTRTTDLETIATENARLYESAQNEIAQRARAEDALKLAAQAAESATLAKSQFLANMSHEIRTPLNAILGFVQLMLRKEPRDSDDRENLAVIMRSGHHLLGLINDVLSMAKIEAGMIALTESNFDPHALFNLLRETFEQRAASRHLVLHFEISPDFPPAVHADEAKLRQVLINLLGNALKFTQSGEITMRAQWSNGLAHIEVEDTGCGLTDEEIGILFRPFVQTENGAAMREGTGLGLAISRNYVQLMRGEIRIESEKGKGSTFIVDVPLSPVEEQVPAAPTRKVIAIAPGQPRYRMLVADDTPENRILLEKFLVSFGFEVRSVVNGREALDVWTEWKPDLVWMDIRMPVADGYEATRRIREAERASGTRTPVIAITASVFEHDQEKILACGCDEMVLKPFVESSIFDALSRHLGVQWLFADEEPKAEAVTFSPTRLASLPRATLKKLQEAVTAGDIEATYDITTEIEQHDPQIAAELRAMLKSYRLDEIQAAVER